MLSVTIFGPSRNLVYGIQQGCAAIEDVCIYKIVYSYPSAHELLQYLSVFSPKVVFLEIESPDTAFALAALTRQTNPETVVIGFAQQCGREKAVEAAEAGIAEILIPPLSEEDFEQTIIEVLDAQKTEPPDNLFAFLPAKAGSGATTTALNVAGALAREWNRKVLFIDGDLQSGVVSQLTGLGTERSLVDALEIAHQLDDNRWEELPSSAHGFDLLPTPVARRPAAFSKLCYHRFFRFVRSRYDAVVVDLPETPTELTGAVVPQAKDFYIVSSPEPPSLFLARRRVMELRDIGASRTRLNVVVNRHAKGDAPAEEMEKALERRIAGILPCDEPGVRRALQARALVPRETEFGGAVLLLAQSLAGVDLPSPQVAASEPSFFDLLFGRWRRATQV